MRRQFTSLFGVLAFAAAAVCLAPRAQAAVFSDNFDDNAKSANWASFQNVDADPGAIGTAQLVEANGRLELQMPMSSQWCTGVYALRHARLDATKDFSLKVNFHFAHVSSGAAETQLGLFMGTGFDIPATKNNAEFGIGSSNGQVGLGASAHVNGVKLPDNGVQQTAANGTLYVSYNAAADTLFVSRNGYGLPQSQNGDWAAPGMVQGGWHAASVYIAMGGGGQNDVFASGDAYFDNFEITTGVLVNPGTVNFTVNSSPTQGTEITANMPDNSDRLIGVTPFVRTYDAQFPLQAVFTAPATDANGQAFVKWKKDGVDVASSNREVTVFANGPHTLTAVYAGSASSSTTTTAPVTTTTVPAGSFVIDNKDRAATKNFTTQGTWGTGTNGLGKWSPFDPFATYRWAASNSTTTAVATWSTTQLTAGDANVWARWPRTATGAENVTFTVFHASGSTDVVVSQKQNGGKWVFLGAFTFGNDHRVQVSNGGALGPKVLADAVRFTWLSGSTTTVLKPGLLGSYFATKNFTARKFVRRDARINFNWGLGSPLLGVIPANNFSVRWTGLLRVPATGDYTFYTTSDDGARLTLNNQIVIDDMTDHTAKEDASAPITLTAGTLVPIMLEYYDHTGPAKIVLQWSGPSIEKGLIPAEDLLSSN